MRQYKNPNKTECVKTHVNTLKKNTTEYFTDTDTNN